MGALERPQKTDEEPPVEKRPKSLETRKKFSVLRFVLVLGTLVYCGLCWVVLVELGSRFGVSLSPPTVEARETP